MLSVLLSWVSLWGALPLSTTNVKMKSTERGCTFLYVTLRSFLRSRSEEVALLPWKAGFSCGLYLLFVCFISVKNCLDLSKIWDLIFCGPPGDCRDEFFHSSDYVKLTPSSAPSIVTVTCIQPIPHASEQVPNQRSRKICPLGSWSLSLGLLTRAQKQKDNCCLSLWS